MKKSYLLFAIIFFSLTLFTCKDEKETPSKEELLTSKTWIVKTKTLVPSITMGGVVISDISVLDSEDVKKYTYKYNTDGTMIQYDQLNQVKFQTNWSFNADETQLIHNPGIIFNYPIVGDIALTTATINSITTDHINASIPTVYDGIDYVVTIIFDPK